MPLCVSIQRAPSPPLPFPDSCPPASACAPLHTTLRDIRRYTEALFNVGVTLGMMKRHDAAAAVLQKAPIGY